jgi:hypothetical protein
VHSNATGQANRATFQSTGPWAIILKLEDCTGTLNLSSHNFNFVFCVSTMPCKEGEEAMNARDESRQARRQDSCIVRSLQVTINQSHYFQVLEF